MSDKMFFVAIFIALLHVTYAGLAPFINRCEAADSKCIKKATEIALPILVAGLPELGVEPLDPLHYKVLNASSKELILILSDITIVGLKDCVPKKIQRDKPNSKIIVKVICSVVLDGQYEMSGKLLFLPIEGKGKIHVKLNKMLLSADVEMGEKIKNGKVHWVVKGWKHTYELKENSELLLENLFNGNEVLARAINVLLQTSANDVIDEVGPKIIQAIVARVIKALKHFIRSVPAEELALD